MLKLIRNETKEAYLLKNEGEDFFSVGLVDSYENSIINLYTKFFGKSCGTTDTAHRYIFEDLNKFLEFLPFLTTRIDEVNKGMFDLNVKFDYKIACHCSYNNINTDIDFEITHKILSLCGKREIFLSELLKRRLEASDVNKNCKLLSRGIYLIKDKQVDVFKLQLNNST